MLAASEQVGAAEVAAWESYEMVEGMRDAALTLRLQAVGGNAEEAGAELACRQARQDLLNQDLEWLGNEMSGRVDALALLVSPSGTRGALDQEQRMLAVSGIHGRSGVRTGGGDAATWRRCAAWTAWCGVCGLNLAEESMRAGCCAPKLAHGATVSGQGAADGSVLSELATLLSEPVQLPANHYVSIRRQTLLQAVHLRIQLMRFEASLRREALLAVRLAAAVAEGGGFTPWIPRAVR